MNSKVSIIVPVYNAEKYLEKCLDSIINQTYKNLEILCVNDGSTDNSLSILTKYTKKDKRIIIETIPNSGVSKARNIAISKATGNYIMFVDSDDYVELSMVEKMIQSLEKNKADVVRCNNFLEKENGNIKKIEDYHLKNQSLNSNQIDESIISDIITGKLLTYSCVLLIKKETLMKTNLFYEKLKIYEDRVLYLELFLELNKIYFLNEPLYHYVIHSNSCVNSKKLASSHLYNTIAGWEIIISILKEHQIKTDNLLKQLNTYYLEMIIGYLYGTYKNDSQHFKQVYLDIINHPSIKEMLKDYNPSQYSYFIKKTTKLIKDNQYHLLKLLYLLRKIISSPKILLRR